MYNFILFKSSIPCSQYPTVYCYFKKPEEKNVPEGYETGPVVYYEPGTKGIEALFKKLTPSKQISLIWVIGSIFDTPNIQKAATTAEYKGFIRYSPVSTQTVPPK